MQALRQGSNPTPTLVASRAWFVRGYEGNLFIAQDTDLWHTAVTRVPGSLGAGTELAVVDDAAIADMQFLDGWALTSLAQGGCGAMRYTLLAIPTDGPDGRAVPLATNLLTPGVLGRALTFVDDKGMLHLVSIDDLRAALAAAG